MSYLLSWNPTESVCQAGPERWSLPSLNSKVPETGAEFFVVRVGKRNGVKPTGIVGYGQTTGKSHIAAHWRGSKKKVRYIPVNIVYFVNAEREPERVLTVEALQSLDPNQQWAPQQSWIKLKKQAMAPKIRTLFDQLQKQVIPQEESKEELMALGFPEGIWKMVREHRARERSRALVEAKKEKVLARTGTLCCESCRHDFVKLLGGLGARCIEAHHLVPVSKLKRKRLTRLDELALVCANCHRLLHAGDFTPAALRKKLSGEGSQ